MAALYIKKQQSMYQMHCILNINSSIQLIYYDVSVHIIVIKVAGILIVSW